MGRKVVIIGLDCATPQLVFDQFKGKLPNIEELISYGYWGKLESVIPPITCPAWMSMMTSKNPGKLGIYGFRHRKNNSYKEAIITNYTQIKEECIWDILAKYGKKSGLIGVPETYPPSPINGYLVTSFMTPSIDVDYTYPRMLREEIRQVVGRYMLDVPDFRTNNKDQLLTQIFEMTEKRFKLIKHLLYKKPVDFFISVEIGLDRLHHGFWKYFDKNHFKYEPGNPFENVIPEYYKYIDKEIGEIMNIVDKDTIVFIVSDHGAKEMEGCICINEWLIKEGYLALKSYPEKIESIEKLDVDWKNTKAWAWGGYYARVFLNLKGREAEGIIEPNDFEKERDLLIEKLKNITDDKGNPLNNKIYKPQDLYKVCNGDSSDILAFFGDLKWRAAGTVGHNKIHIFENDTGPDDAVHDWKGIFIMYDPYDNGRGAELKDLHILDIAPTVLNKLGCPIPYDMEGKVIR